MSILGVAIYQGLLWIAKQFSASFCAVARHKPGSTSEERPPHTRVGHGGRSRLRYAHGTIRHMNHPNLSKISVVVPVFNEAQSLPTLHGETFRRLRGQSLRLEIIFVSDGSTDSSWDEIARLAAADPRVRGIRFRRNFGKAAALAAGFAEVRGDLVFTLDADLQDDPAEMPRFIAELDRGFDVVSGYKQVRHDPWHKVLPSRVFNWLVSRMTGVKLHDHNCGYKVYRREVPARSSSTASATASCRCSPPPAGLPSAKSSSSTAPAVSAALNTASRG